MSPQGRTGSHRTERGIIFITGACEEGREVEAEGAGVWRLVGGNGGQQTTSNARGVKSGGWRSMPGRSRVKRGCG
jgi:hypothetical protein